MITGAHAILYSTNSDADRSFLQDILGLTHVDVGDGWLIFGLPPSEVAVHPSDKNSVHELYLMCEDIAVFIAELAKHQIECSPPQNQGWGILTSVTLPGGGKLGVYEPRHARPPQMPLKAAKASAAKPKPVVMATAKPAAKKPAAKKPAAKKPAPAAKKKKPAKRR